MIAEYTSSSVISSVIEIEKSANTGKRTKTPAKIERRYIVAVERDDRETIDFIGFRGTARQYSHSLRQPSLTLAESKRELRLGSPSREGCPAVAASAASVQRRDSTIPQAR